MEFSEIDLNQLNSLRKNKSPLVIRVHMNHFEETHPLKKIYLKEKKTVRSKPKSKSKIKGRSSSIKLFMNAHLTSENETFLFNDKHVKNLNNSKTIVFKKESKQNTETYDSRKKENTTTCESSDQKQHISLKISKQKEHQVKNIIQKIHESVKSNESLSKDVNVKLSQIIYGQEGGCFEDRSFQFIEESSIHGDADCFYFQVGNPESTF